MYARSTLDNLAKGIKSPEKQAEFKAAVSAIQGEIHDGVEIILSDALVAAGLKTYVDLLEEKRTWLYLTSASDLKTLNGKRYEAHMA